MGIYLIAPLVLFLIWYAIHHFRSSDSGSAIESLHSAESENDDVEKEKQEIVRKSESDIF